MGIGDIATPPKAFANTFYGAAIRELHISVEYIPNFIIRREYKACIYSIKRTVM